MTQQAPKLGKIGFVGKALNDVQPVTSFFGKQADMEHLGSAVDALEYLRQKPVGLVCVFAPLNDMRWLTFLRVLRTDEKIPFVAVMLFLEQNIRLERKDKELLESYRINSILQYPPSPADLAEAMNRIQKSENPEEIEAKLKKAKDRYREGMLTSASRIYNEIIQEHEHSLAARAGIMYAGKGNQDEFMRQLKIVLEADPENYNFKFELLRHYFTINDMQKFNDLFNEVTRDIENSDDMYWLLQLGEVCLSLKLLSFCGTIAEIMMRHPKRGDLWQPFLLKARTALAMGDIEEAQRMVAKAVSHTDKERPEILNLRAIIKRKQGAEQEALELFQQAYHISSTDHRLAFNIALCYKTLKQEENAIQSLKKALELCPTYKRAREMLDKMSH